MATSASRGTLCAPSSADEREAERGERDAEDATGDGQQQAFADDLSGQASPAGPERCAHGKFLLTPQRARKLQVRHVRARDEQHERHRRHQHDNRPPDVADDLLLERHDTERQAAVRRIQIRMLATQSRRDRVHLGARGRERHARLQLAHDVVVLAVAARDIAGPEGQRHDNVGVLGAVQRRHHLARQRKRLLQNADDLVRLIVQPDRSSDDTRVGAVTAHPCGMPEDRRARQSGNDPRRP